MKVSKYSFVGAQLINHLIECTRLPRNRDVNVLLPAAQPTP